MTVIKYPDQMLLVEEMVCFCLQVTDPLRGARTGVQGRNMEVGTKAEATEEHCSEEVSKLTVNYLPYIPRPVYQEVILPTVGWAFLHPLAIKKMHSQTCSQANPMEAIFQSRFPLPRYVKLTPRLVITDML